MIPLLNSARDLKKGYKGLTVSYNPIQQEGQTYNLEVVLPKALAQQFTIYLQQLLNNPRIKGKERIDLEKVFEQLNHHMPAIILGTPEANFRFMQFMEKQKGRYIEGLKGYGDTHYYQIK